MRRSRDLKVTPIRVREALESDIDRIIQIERSWQHLSHWSVSAYNRLLKPGSFAESFVAEIEGCEKEVEIAGFVIFNIADRISEIYNIAVDRAHARSGVGADLMKTVLDNARRGGAHKVVLEVRKSNHIAITFYLRFGFSLAGERDNYYSNPVEDAYIMEKELRI